MHMRNITRETVKNKEEYNLGVRKREPRYIPPSYILLSPLSSVLCHPRFGIRASEIFLVLLSLAVWLCDKPKFS